MDQGKQHDTGIHQQLSRKRPVRKASHNHTECLGKCKGVSTAPDVRDKCQTETGQSADADNTGRQTRDGTGNRIFRRNTRQIHKP